MGKMHKFCAKFLCNLLITSNSARYSRQRAAQALGVCEGVYLQLIALLAESADNRLCVFSQNKRGGGISGKKFFSISKMVCSGQNSPKVIFQFRITVSQMLISLLKKIKPIF